MATFQNMNDGYYEDITSRSPRGYRGQQTYRSNSRPADSGYGSMQGSMYANNHSYGNNGIQSMRYGGGPLMQNGMQNGAGTSNFPYDSAAAQTWNAGSAGLHNLGMGSMQDPSRSVRPSRGRGPVSNVSSLNGVLNLANKASFGMNHHISNQV